MDQPTFKIRTLAENEAVQQEGGPSAFVTLQRAARGTSGVRNYAGYAQEEYLYNLTGTARADIFDKMRRCESQVAMVLNSVMNPIKKATWEIEPAEEGSADFELHAEFIEHVLFKDMDKPWRSFLSEALTCVPFGHAVFEVTHKAVLDHPDFGSYNGIRQLGWRSPRTLIKWNLDKATGALLSVTQYAVGDLESDVDMDARFLIIFSIGKEGDNYEGVSLLRPCYGAWKRKDLFLKLQAIGVEKYAVPTPVLKIPKNMANSAERTDAEEALEAYTSHEKAYLTIPEGWEIDFPNSNFEPEKVQVVIDAQDKAMVKAFLANFLELGMSSSGGSWALSTDQSDFFLSGIEYVADEIAEVLNQKLIPDLIKMKYGPQAQYPRLKYAGISDSIGEEFGTLMKNLADSKIITPDDPLEDSIRKRMRLPKRSEEGKRETAAPTFPGAPGGVDNGLKDDEKQPPAKDQAAADKKLKDEAGVALSERVRLADRAARAQMTDGKAELKTIMKDGLAEIGSDLIAKIIAKVKKLPDSQRLAAIKKLNLTGVPKYKAAVREALAKLAHQGIEQARREVPKKKGVKLAGSPDSIRLGEFDDLPKDVKKRVQTQADLLVESHIARLEEAAYFRFTSSVDSTDSDAILEADLNDAVETFVDGVAVDVAAGNAASATVNTARQAFFFDPEVLDEIESFTFTNPSPESPICQDLAGTVFAKDDPEAERYYPPLHHNCKSYLVPNLKGTTKEIDPNGLRPSSPSLDKYITLAEHERCSGH